MHRILHAPELLFILVIGSGLLLVPGSAAGAFDELIDSPMYRLPALPLAPNEIVFPDELKGLWLRALERPEAEMRLRAAEAITLAQQRGMKGLESTIPRLIAALDAPDQHEAVRVAVARALAVLDARQSAASLLRLAETGGVDLREIIEPTLVRWDHRPAHALWLARLQAPATPPRSLIFAMQGLAAAREEKAVDRLRELAGSKGVSGPLRVEAARALGAICTNGLDKDADMLAAGGLIDRLVAARMLHRHSSPAAIALLKVLVGDPEPAVSVVATGRLLEIDPALVLPLLKVVLAHADPEMRSLGIDAVHRSPALERVHLLADRLPDVHPAVRKKARLHLKDWAANKELRERVLQEATGVLAGKDWRGLEQAALLLTQLDHRPAAGRLVQLLTSNRPEVFVTAAWGLRELAVAETLAPVTKYVRAEYDRVVAGKPLEGRQSVSGGMIDHQLSQLNQLLGQQKYQPAEPVLRLFVPKRINVGECRAAAIWALGLLHEDKLDAGLASELMGRLNDRARIPPEDARVPRMAAISLGRMKAVEALPTLRRYYSGGPPPDGTPGACAWAIERITGEPTPALVTVRLLQLDWFLTPSR
jgi:HEAT repeat protein